MRTIDVKLIKEQVSKLCIESNFFLGEDIKTALSDAISKEDNELSKDVLEKLVLNSEIAAKDNVPICQDTGMAVVFLEIGQEVNFINGDLKTAIDEGVADGYLEGYLRKSIVRSPFDRVNTNDNTPSIIHYSIVPGDLVKIIVAPKGFGSENMSVVKMLKPSEGVNGVKQVIIDAVKAAASNPCPPIIVGVGVGGTMEKCALIAKQALLREVGKKNCDKYISDLEDDLLESINNLDIGPAGFGGKTTALAVNIEVFATHIAGLPVAVNIGCHATRHKEVTI